MKKIVLAIVAVLVLLAAYLTLWPVPIRPVSWSGPMPLGYVGPHAVNTKLANLKIISLGKEEGPEHIVIGKDGKLYTTVASGNILRMNPDGSSQEVFVNTGGRVLGFDFDARGNMIAADVNKGLMPTRWWWLNQEKYISAMLPRVSRPKTGADLLARAFLTLWSNHPPAVFWNTSRQRKLPAL
jgi:hypothetical protein